MPEPALLLAAALLGGITALDATSLGQFMLSRPLVAATLGGLVAGSPEDGIRVGVVLEALHLAVLPVGAARYPEPGPPAVAAGLAFAASGAEPPALLVAVLFALAWEYACGATVERMRHFNARFAGVPAEGADPALVDRRQWTAIAVDFARGALLTVLGTALLAWLLGTVDGNGFPTEWARAVLGLVVVAGAASALRLFGRGRYPFFVGGALAGVAVVFLLLW
ncbi:MAG TPA: PTS sugar transporter subunit IIC [Longimicrobium sp.]|nr:PTS sugar transporter subunit IIC [Longimicrobium sp.]